MYWLKKYNNYMGTIKRIGEEYKREYVHRFSDEFKRGLELGELDESVFTKISWSNIQFITKDPNGFYMKKVATPVKVRRLTKKVEKLEKQNAKLQNDIKIIKGSRSYRLGWFMLTIPRKIKALLKAINKGEIMSVKVSVILPVYNVSEYLRQCMDSIVGQTLKDIEIICVDDGSTDDSLEILKEYEAKDKRVKVIEQKNAGAGAARNNGLAIATGEYLSFLDSDDFLSRICQKSL